MLNVAVPLVFTGLGIAVAFKSSVFNLGGEGQIYAGGLAATIVCLALPVGERNPRRAPGHHRRHGARAGDRRDFPASSR